MQQKLKREELVSKCFIHKFKEIKNTGIYSYRECIKCGKREVKQLFEFGYQPINRKWLKGDVCKKY